MAFTGASTATLNFVMQMRGNALAALRQHQAALQQVGQAAGQAGTRLNQAGQGVRGFTGHAAQATSQVVEMGKAIGQMVASIGAAIATMSGFTRTVKDFGELEAGMIGVAKTTGMSAGEITGLTEDIVQMSMKLPSTTNELTELAQAAGQVGVSGKDNILAYTETLAKLGSASNLAGEEAAGMLATIQILTKTPFSEISNMASSIVQLGNDSRATEREIAVMAAEVAKGTANYKLSAQTVLGLSTAFVELAVTPDLAKSTVQRLYGTLSQATKEGGQNLRLLAEMTGMTKKEFTDLFRSDPTKAVMKFVEAYGKMNTAQKNTSPLMKAFKLDQLELLGVLDPVSLNLDMVSKRINQSTTAWRENIAVDNEAETAITGLFSQLQLTANAVTAVSQTIGAEFAPAIKTASEALRGNLKDLRDWFRGLDEGKRQLVAWGALGVGVFTSVALALAVLTPLLPVIAAGLAAIGGALLVLAPWAAAIGLVALAFSQVKSETDHVRENQEKLNKVLDEAKRIEEGLKTAEGMRLEKLVAQKQALIEVTREEVNRARVNLANATAQLDAETAAQVKAGPRSTFGPLVNQEEQFQIGNKRQALKDWKTRLDQVEGRISLEPYGPPVAPPAATTTPTTTNPPPGDVPDPQLDNDAVARAKNNLKEILDAARAAQAELALFNRTGSETALEHAQDMQKAKEALLQYAESARLETTDLAEIGAKAGISQAQLAEAFRQTRDAASGIEFKRYTMDAERHTEATNKLAEATLKGARAIREQTIQNEIADTLAEKKIKRGTPQAEMVEANIRSTFNANDNLSATQALQAQREKLGLSKAELGLTSETEEKRALAVQHLADVNELAKIGVGWSDEQRREWLQNADAIALNQKAIEKHNADMQAFREAWVESGRVIGNALGDALMGTESWGDALKKIPSQLASIAYQLLVMKPLEQAMTGFDFWGMASKGAQFALGAWGSGATGVDMATYATAPVIGVESVPLASARGNVFPFARGSAFTNSIVDTATMFKFAKGQGFANGVMGEAGPEAVVPLRRMSDGNLGIASVGGGGGGVTINAPITVNVQGSQGGMGGADLGKMVGQQVAGELRAMVVDELRKQMRPGGVMY